MKRKTFATILASLTIILGFTACAREQQSGVSVTPAKQAVNVAAPPAPNLSQQPAKEPIPAFQSAESAGNFPATLSPEMFTGTVRAAYQMVKEIPQTIRHLPCYCHCDKSIGHKSLHSCFESDHAAKCGICLNSAMTAYKLQKEQKLTPAQIRERLIAEYGQSSM